MDHGGGGAVVLCTCVCVSFAPQCDKGAIYVLMRPASGVRRIRVLLCVVVVLLRAYNTRLQE